MERAELPGDNPAEKRLERLIEEFTAKIRMGEGVTTEEYLEREPDLAARLQEILPAIRMIEKARGNRSPPFP